MEWWVTSLLVYSETLKAQQTWEGRVAFQGDLLSGDIWSNQPSRVKFFSSSLHTPVQTRRISERHRDSQSLQRSCFLIWAHERKGNFMLNIHTRWQGGMGTDSPKYICKPCLGSLHFTLLYKVNGNQGTTIPESSPPLILNNQKKMGSLYSGAVPASRSPGNKAPYRLSLDLKA